MPQKINFTDKVLTRIGRLDKESVQSYMTGLIRARKEIEEILDQINEGILLFDLAGFVKMANRRAFLWLGFQRYVKGRSHIEDLVEDPQARQFVLEHLKRPEPMASEEVEVLFPREMTLRLHWFPLEVGEVKEILLRIENITQDKTRSEEAAKAYQIDGLVRLAAGVAHEIGNPLNSIQIHSELLKEETSKLPKTKQSALLQLIDVLSTETKRLDEIVRSFLRATRRPPLRFRKDSLNEILETAVNFFRIEMKRQKIRVKLSLDREIPEFLLDRDRLHQAFINLIKNALEAMPRGGGLRISTKRKERLCFVRFEDGGIGIEEVHLPHIFEPYYTTKKEGSGLGLSQVYQVVRDHGGRIDVNSRTGKGSIFTLAFPIRQEPLSLPQPHGNYPFQEKEVQVR